MWFLGFRVTFELRGWVKLKPWHLQGLVPQKLLSSSTSDKKGSKVETKVPKKLRSPKDLRGPSLVTLNPFFFWYGDDHL
jgi:hypothetical protein